MQETGDTSSIHGSGRSPVGRNGNLLQCSCLENSQRSLVGCRLWGHTESDTTEATQQQQQVGHSFSFKEQVSFNFMAVVTFHSDFGAQENKIYHCFQFFPIYLPGSDKTRCHDLSFLNAEF